MKLLHILSESEADAFFYERIAERVTGSSYSRCDVRLRRGAGYGQVLASIKLLLKLFPRNAPRPDAAVLLSVDNDRCPDHPGAGPYSGALSSAERRKPSRWKAIQQAMQDRWGEYRGDWPVDVAVAVPAEMIESWVLLLLDPARGVLPIYSRKTDKSAIAFYHPVEPSPQLKDLAEEEARQRGVDKQDLLLEAAEAEIEIVKQVSPSFALFVSDLARWRS